MRKAPFIVGLLTGTILALVMVLSVIYVADVINNAVTATANATATTGSQACYQNVNTIPLIGWLFGGQICQTVSSAYTQATGTAIAGFSAFLGILTAGFLQLVFLFSILAFLMFFILGYVGALIVGRKGGGWDLGAFALTFLLAYSTFFYLFSSPNFTGAVGRAILRFLGGP